ncbi:hypothetical protein LLG96_00065 [bacterium]|nr:hypothetical protein [bacterium]
MVLVPVLGIHALALFAELAIPHEVTLLMFQTINNVVTGLGIVWILSCLLENQRGIAAFFLAVVILAAGGIVTILTSTSISDQIQTGPYMIMYAFCSSVILVSLTASRAITRKQYNPSRFRLWLLIVHALISSVGFTLIVFSVSIIESRTLHINDLFQIFAVGLVTGLVLFVILIPFMILTFNNKVYHDRFDSVFHLQSAENSEDSHIVSE